MSVFPGPSMVHINAGDETLARRRYVDADQQQTEETSKLSKKKTPAFLITN